MNRYIETLNWKATRPELLPDFIIGGAMKCGTTTLRHILNKHPQIFIPNYELNFFDFDNILQHPDYNYFNYKKKSWQYLSMASNSKILWEWYESNFIGNKNTINGEDSTTYLASPYAAKRIALQEKSIKLIFLLRNPIERTYSNYWHLLRSGKAIYGFERTLKTNPYSILNRSLYKAQLIEFYKYIPYGNIKIILFEDLINNRTKTINDIGLFLNIDSHLFPNDLDNIHQNETKIAKSISLQLFQNNILRLFTSPTPLIKLPLTPRKPSNFSKIVQNIHNKINPLQSNTSININPNTKKFLAQYFFNELTGLDDLIGQEVLAKWHLSAK